MGELVARSRRWRPVLFFTHGPEHPLLPYPAQDPLAFPAHASQGLAPHSVQEVRLFASANAATYVDIAGGFERKLAARLAH